MKFDNNKRNQIKKWIENNNAMVYIIDIPITINNNYFLSKNSIEYI